MQFISPNELLTALPPVIYERLAPCLQRVRLHTHTLSEQIAQAIVCSQFHTTDQRLARWLLLAGDRTRNGAFNIKHEAMAQILGATVVSAVGHNVARDMEQGLALRY